MSQKLPRLKKLLSLAFFFAASTAIADPVQKTSLHPEFNSSGLVSLKWNETELLDAPHPEMQKLKEMTTGSGSSHAFDRVSESFDPKKLLLTQNYSWGKITIGYHPMPDRLVMDVGFTDNGSYDFSEAGIELLHLKFPATPAGLHWEKRDDIHITNNETIPAILADWGAGRLALCNDNLDQPVKFGWRALAGKPWALQAWFEGKPAVGRHSTRFAQLSIRMSDDHSSPWSIAQDVCQAFGKKYPSELKWDDHRSIGSAFLATSIAGYPHNPRGWFFDRDLDTSTPSGRQAFDQELMKYEDQVLSHCKMMNAQGVLVWDLEGQEMPHATSYLADARVLHKVAPEMDAIADRFFKRLTDAGLRTGVTIRPTRVEPAPDGHGWAQVDVANPIDEMDSKIGYAQKRWGCTIFYVDSNVNFVRDAKGNILDDPAMSAEDFRTLARRHPGCLLMPEHKTDRYYAYTAPYSELPQGFIGTPPQIRLAYPNSFALMRVVDGPPLDSPEVVKNLIAAIHHGDILMFRPWWDDPTTPQIRSIYQQSAIEKQNAQ